MIIYVVKSVPEEGKPFKNGGWFNTELAARERSRKLSESNPDVDWVVVEAELQKLV